VVVLFLANVNTTNELSNPFLSPDLLHMYNGSKGDGITHAERVSVNDAFGAGARVASLAGPVGDDDAPAISADGRLIVFESRRSGNDELFYATRPDATAMFTTPVLVPSVNTPNRADTSPALSADACRLYFSSDRGGTQDLYVATVR
jgi:Tol biopolymer transport system component